VHTRRFWVGPVLAAIAGGCAVGPNYRTPEISTPDNWSGLKSGAAATQPSASTTQPADLSTWWQELHDPGLDELITAAVESNLDLRLATARVREARATRDVTAAPLWPQINLDGSYNYRGSSENAGPAVNTAKSRVSGLPTISVQPGAGGVGPPDITVSPARAGPMQLGGSRAPSLTLVPGTFSTANGTGVPTAVLSPPGSAGSNGPGGSSSASGASSGVRVSRQLNLFQLGFDATWELDIFGGVRRAVEAADADVAAAEETRRDVLVTLLSEVALNYVQLRGAQRRLTIASENIAAQQDTLELTRVRFQAGFTNELDVTQAQAQLATTQSQVPLLQTAIRQAIYQLSVLVGQPPGALVAELEQAAPIPSTPPDVPIGLPSDLLRRRPDIRVAERQLASATAQIGVATADLFPKFSLTGSFGTQTSNFRHFLDAKSLFWSIGPAVSWPIGDAGRIRANIAVQNARQEEALDTYEKTVLTAFQDVESALIAYENEKARHQALIGAVASNQKSTDLSNELYSRGLTAFLNVLVSQQALYVSQDQLVQSETAALTDLIALYKALGGGWEGAEFR
jgi:NodT family efflux transporter outer membrane factor (OMF) lipoprotein